MACPPEACNRTSGTVDDITFFLSAITFVLVTEAGSSEYTYERLRFLRIIVGTGMEKFMPGPVSCFFIQYK